MKKSLTIAALFLTVAYSCEPVSAQSAYSFDIYGHHVDIAVPRHCADISCISVWAGSTGPVRHAERRRAPHNSTAAAEPAAPKPRTSKRAAKPSAESTPQAIAKPTTPPASTQGIDAQTQSPTSRPSTAPATQAKQTEPKQTEPKQAAPKETAPNQPGTKTPEPAASVATVDTAKPPAKPMADPAPAKTDPKQAETKPAAPPAALEAKPQPPTSSFVRRADTETAMPKVAIGRSSAEGATAVAGRTALQSAAAQGETEPDAGQAEVSTVRIPLPPAEQKRIVNALNEPTADDATTSPTDDATASPLGFWITELDAEKVHIVACGKELCGYAVDSKTDQDRAEPLIRMKPVGARKWSGRINEPRGTGSYASTISQKEPDILHVQGCAFKGFMCDGQIWRRAS